ncbi:glycosyltransferase family 4 protein [Candidatus Woesearchaeota archaeon]|jgi:glycosyltransferase involved in cell wall biosynthesis|nr:glycosyltransferase family 4 protein [Candidatus Woesearchaeota archaeon]
MISKINILHTEWSDGWGGQEIRILAESLEFIKRGYGVSIAAQPNSQLIQKAREANISVLPLTMNKGFNIGAILKLIKFIKINKVNIIHTHSSVDSRTGGIAGRIAGIKVVRSRHISMPVSKSWLTWFQYMKLANRVITSGEFIKQELIKVNKMLPERIVSAPAGVDEKRFSINKEASNIKVEFKIDKDCFIIGMVSVIRSWKGHEFVIRAMESLKKKIPNVHLLIVGDGPVKEKVLSLIKELSLEESITLVGYQKDPVPFYQVMDVVVLPSYAGEATSQTLPQAMLMGKPVISTNIGGLPEVVIDRETGLIVLPKDSKSIYQAVLELFSDANLRDTIVKNGREHALNFFTFKKMVDTTEDVYIELLNK